ncbi:MAG: preprotein translocase subunit SecE [Anaerofustis stercorihominis]|nr:preprotein translocase subunit SecE [Anaerofustis stercorihominis]
MANTPGTAKVKWYKKPVIFLQGVLKELKKVHWPNKKELFNHTLICLAIVAIFVVVIFCFDTVFSVLTNFLYSL